MQDILCLDKHYVNERGLVFVIDFGLCMLDNLCFRFEKSLCIEVNLSLAISCVEKERGFGIVFWISFCARRTFCAWESLLLK